MREDELQSECFRYAWNTYPDMHGLLFHVPNGGKRTMVEANRFKQMGVVAGIPDMICLSPVIAFELKAEKGYLSKEQKAIHSTYESNHIPVYVIRDFATFKQIIDSVWSDQRKIEKLS